MGMGRCLGRGNQESTQGKPQILSSRGHSRAARPDPRDELVEKGRKGSRRLDEAKAQPLL